MNFLDAVRLKCVSVIKFTGPINFSIDSDAIKNEIVSEFGHTDTNLFSGQGYVVDIDTKAQYPVDFTIMFKGFFRQALTGKLTLPDHIDVKSFSKFLKLKPYLLVFYYDELKEL